MKVLVTGASGFVGQNLCTYLNLYGIEVGVLSRSQLNSIDLRHLEGYDAVVHLAGKAHDLKDTSTPDQYYEVNYELTRKLFDKFREADTQKFIFLSSVKAAADRVDGILSEEIIPAPSTHYGKSKLMAENYIHSQPISSEKSYYILRPCMIHGPGNKGNLNLLYKFVQTGIPYPLAGFHNQRSFLSVENLCYVIKKLLTEGAVESGTFNVADDGTLSTSELIRIIGRSLDKRIVAWKIPSVLIKTIAKIGDVLRLPFNSEKLDKLTENYVVSNEKIKRTYKIKLPIDIQDGIMTTAKSFKS